MLEYFADEMVNASHIPGGAGSLSKGIYTPAFGAPVPIRVIAPQPVNARDLQMLEDGEHVRNYLKTWTEAEVKTREQSVEADRLVIFGRTYRVMQVENREPLGKYRKVFIHEITADE